MVTEVRRQLLQVKVPLPVLVRVKRLLLDMA
jgi:hypothetical protein